MFLPMLRAGMGGIGETQLGREEQQSCPEVRVNIYLHWGFLFGFFRVFFQLKNWNLNGKWGVIVWCTTGM